MIRHIAVLSLAAALTAGCRSNGPNPSTEVQSGLRSANLSDVTVEWDSSARIAHLKGTVDRPTVAGGGGGDHGAGGRSAA